MTLIFKGKFIGIKQNISNCFERYGVGGAALLLTIELIWIVSVLIPVLAVIGALFNATNAWMAVLPGFMGAITFMIVLTIGGLAATLPSVYLGKWREGIWQWMEKRHPALDSSATQAQLFPRDLDMQDAD